MGKPKQNEMKPFELHLTCISLLLSPFDYTVANSGTAGKSTGT